MSKFVSYETPLNERMRTFLRLENLMARFRHCIAMNTEWDSHCALMVLIEIFNLTTRGDLKSEVMKEMERQIANMTRLQDEPSVDKTSLNNIINSQRLLVQKLHSMNGQLGQHIKNNDFLSGVRQRATIPGGSCDFDLPQFRYWLSRPLETRSHILKSWIKPYEQIQEAIAVVLGIIRQSADMRTHTAKGGFYQQNLDLAQPYQMIRIDMPTDSVLFPEVSAGKHRFTVRFLMQGDMNVRSKQSNQDIDFRLCCCAL